jgi:hypothetical protein
LARSPLIEGQRRWCWRVTRPSLGVGGVVWARVAAMSYGLAMWKVIGLRLGEPVGDLDDEHERWRLFALAVRRRIGRTHRPRVARWCWRCRPDARCG